MIAVALDIWLCLVPAILYTAKHSATGDHGVEACLRPSVMGRSSQDHKANIFFGPWPGLAFDSTTLVRTRTLSRSGAFPRRLQICGCLIGSSPIVQAGTIFFGYTLYFFCIPGQACWDSPFFHWMKRVGHPWNRMLE